ncbi:MAG: anaerobic sulfatase maturase [Fimbriimonadaceae bacterium]|nr:anaerobic sulfatase maturase [Fimbriimonadaceae bacterium]
MPEYAGEYPALYPSLSGLDEVLPERPRAFHIMTKPIGALCNLDCTYCFYLRKEDRYPEHRGSAWRMSDELLEEYVRQYIAAQQVPEVHFAWQGGEPTLLGVGFFRRVVELQRQYRQPGMVIHNAFQTNGTLLDDEWCEFLHQHHFLIGLSVDGPPAIHDHYRVNKGQRGSFEAVRRGLELLRQHQVEHNLLCVVNDYNSRFPLEVYRFFRDELDERFYQFIPAIEFLPAGGVTPWSVRPEAYGEFLCAIFDEWVRRDVGQRYVQIFDVALRGWCGLDPGLCVFSKHCGNALALEHNGDLYSCDHFVTDHNRLGNIVDVPLADLVAGPLQRKFGRDKCDALPDYCRRCEVRFVCNGGCPKDRFIKTPDGEAGLNYLCAGYRRFFNHIDPAMKFMAAELRNQRPPANVMAWLRARELPQAAVTTVGRNDACPCGSGRKYKQCCGARGR